MLVLSSRKLVEKAWKLCGLPFPPKNPWKAAGPKAETAETAPSLHDPGVGPGTHSPAPGLPSDVALRSANRSPPSNEVKNPDLKSNLTLVAHAVSSPWLRCQLSKRFCRYRLLGSLGEGPSRLHTPCPFTLLLSCTISLLRLVSMISRT